MSIRHFAYGAIADPRVISALLGKVPRGVSAIVCGYALHVQGMNHIPAVPRAILAKNWPDTFASYGIKKMPGKSVRGIVWTITNRERDLLRKWEFVGDWFEEVKVPALCADGHEIEVTTKCLPLDQPSGLYFPDTDEVPLPNDIAKTLELAARFRSEHDVRVEA